MKWVRLAVEGLGPISRAEVTIRPLTVIIGKNCFGKSLLINFAYLLSDTLPDFSRLRKEVSEEADGLAEKAYNALEAGNRDELSNILSEMLHLYFKGLGPALGVSLTKRFKEFFNVSKITDLFRGYVAVGGDLLSYSVRVEDDQLLVELSGYEEFEVYVKSVGHEAAGTFILDIEVRHAGGKELRVPPYWVETPSDIRMLISGHVLPYTLTDLYPLSFGIGEAFLLTDSRAGILRLARTVMVTSLEYGRLLVPARESSFLAAYSKLMARFQEKGPLKELVSFLRVS